VLVLLAEGLREASRRLRETRPPAEGTTDLADQVTAYLQTHLSQAIRVADLADMVGLNRDYLGRLFRRATGMSIQAFLTRRRMEVALELCHESDLAIKQIAIGLGYRDPLYFSRAFRRFHGMCPLSARRQARASDTPEHQERS
jgi:AraC-like DNA-binding protein